MVLRFPYEKETKIRVGEFNVDLLNPYAGAFLGAFMSEGNLTDNLSVKITCKDLNYINFSTECVNNIFGEHGATKRWPTREHKYDESGFHKYYSKLVAKWLIEGYGIVPGRKVLNNKGLPEVVFKSRYDDRVKEWFINYLQMRFSGDGHVRNNVNAGKCKQIITRRIALSRNIALNVNKTVIEDIHECYVPKKHIRKYPIQLIEELRNEMRKKRNFPKEFVDIRNLLLRIFDIKSKIYPYGQGCIYFDKKREKYVVTAIYKIVISRKEDIIKFYKKVNFASFDTYNRGKLINLLSSYKK